jgi:hypothetical protein
VSGNVTVSDNLDVGKVLTLPRVSGHAAGAETPQAESLVIHYDTTVDSAVSGTTVVDISGQGVNGTLNNSAAYSSSNRSLNQDATGDAIYIYDIGNPAGAWVHSVSFWVYFLDLTSDRIFEVYSGAIQDKIPHFVLESDGDVRWDFYSSSIKTTSQPIAPGIWYHIALSYNGGVHGLTNSKIYINGVSSASQDDGSGNALNIDANKAFYIGAGTKQRISNFKLWSGVALTAEEVAMEYALGRTGKSINLTDTALCLGGTVPRAQLDVRGSIIVNDVVRQPNKPFFACDVANFGLKDNGTQTIYVHNDRTDTLTSISETGCRWKLGATTGNHTYRTNNVKLVRVLNDTTSETSGVKVPYTGYYHLTHLTRTANLNVGTSFWIYSQRHDKYIQTSMAGYRVPWGGNTGHIEIPNSVSASLYLEGGDVVIFVLNNVTVSQNPTRGGYEQFVSLVML